MEKYYPDGDKSDTGAVDGPSIAATIVQILKQCSDDLTRENFMRQAANLHQFELPMLQPGIMLDTSPLTSTRRAGAHGRVRRLESFGPVLSGMGELISSGPVT